MHGGIARDFRVERNADNVPGAHAHNFALMMRHHLHAFTGAGHNRGANKRRIDHDFLTRGCKPRQMNLRRIDLRAEGVTPNRNIQHTERLLPRSRIINHSREHNQPGTGSQGRQAPRNRLNQRLAQPKNPGQPVNRGRFAAGQNQRIQVRQLLGTFDEHHLRLQ